MSVMSVIMEEETIHFDSDKTPMTHYMDEISPGVFNRYKARCGAKLKGIFHPTQKVADCVICAELWEKSLSEGKTIGPY